VKRRLSHDIARYAPGLIIPIGVATLSTVVFARIASPRELGEFLVITAAAGSVSTLCGQWLNQSVLRFYPTYLADGELPRFVRAVSILAVASGLVAAAVVIGALWFGLGADVSDTASVLGGAALAFLTTAGAGRASLLQASFQLRRYSLLNATFAVLKFVLPVLFLVWLQPFAALLWGSAVAALISWVVLTMQSSVPIAESLPTPPRPVRDAPTLLSMTRQAAAFGIPLTLSEVGVQILQFSDRWVISLILGSAAVGLYGTNYSIAEKLVILVQAPLIYAAHSPIVAAWERHDQREVASLLRTATRWLALLGAPIVAFALVRGELISAFLLGEEYAPGHIVIPLAAASILLYAASQYGHKSFELGQRTWVITAALAVAAVLNVLAVIGLTLAYGYVGGALGTAVGYAVYAVLVYVLSRQRLSLFAWRIPWRSLLMGTLGAICGGAVWAWLTPARVRGPVDLLWLLGSGLLGLLVYAGVLLVAHEVALPVDRILRFGHVAWLRRLKQSATPRSG
jgi:O-antigen/teichoic acid export membrane protein